MCASDDFSVCSHKFPGNFCILGLHLVKSQTWGPNEVEVYLLDTVIWKGVIEKQFI